MRDLHDQKELGKLIAKCWLDPKFHEQLLADPVKTLTNDGFDIAKELKIQVIENTEGILNLVIPAKPKGLSDVDMVVHALDCCGCSGCPG